MVRDRLFAFIFPNTPKTEAEKAAFEQAVQFQTEYENENASQDAINIPIGATSVQIGHYRLSFAGKGYRGNAVLTKDNISPSAYSVLLRAGLLYKGVDTVGGDCECL